MAAKRSATALFLVAAAFAAAAAGRDDAAPAPARQRELLRLLKQDCGACHGLRLTGGLGPALTPNALEDKPAENLAATIVHGRPGSAMPPWRSFLSTAEAQWLATRLREGTTDAP
jgi:cytochrome c55X